MSNILIDITNSLNTIITVAFFFLCIFIAYRVFSKPEIKSVLTQGGFLPFFAAVLIAGSFLSASFIFLISNGIFHLQIFFQGSFGFSDLTLLLRDVVVVLVYAVGSFFITRSYKKAAGPSTGNAAMLGVVTILGLLTLTGCSTSSSGNVGQQLRGFLGSANWPVNDLLSAIAYVAVGLIIYHAIKTPFISLPLRKLGRFPHSLVFCVLTNILFGVIYRPIYSFYLFINGIANQDGFLPILANLLGLILFVVGFGIVAYFSRAGRKSDPAVNSNN